MRTKSPSRSRQPVTVVNDPEFMGDTGIPAEPGHYAFHPAPGAAGIVQVTYIYRPLRMRLASHTSAALGAIAIVAFAA
jgi:hypothetical protein